MAEMAQFMDIFQKQIELQQQIEAQRRQIEVLLSRLPVVSGMPPTLASSLPSFAAFEATSVLWKDYWARFKTFAGANSIPEDKLAQVFLSNQATAIFKLLSTLAGQQSPPKDINELTMDDIAKFMENHRAIQVALETEDAANVAKERVYGTKPKTVFKVDEQRLAQATRTKRNEPSAGPKPVLNVKCWRCGNNKDRPAECRFKDAECSFCEHIGHIAITYFGEKESKGQRCAKSRKANPESPQVGRFGPNHTTTSAKWQLGKPTLHEPHSRYLSATKGQPQILGTFNTKATILGHHHGDVELELNVASVPQLNVLSRKTIRDFDIDVRALLKGQPSNVANVYAIRPNSELDLALQEACKELCNNFPDLFKPELGCLRTLDLIQDRCKTNLLRVKNGAFAILEDLNQAYDAGIKRGVWVPTQFNEYETLVVPVRKPLSTDRRKVTLRVRGDYAVTVNSQLDTHRHPMSLPEDLMWKLSGEYYFTKIDLADAYNQVKLAPEIQKRLALRRHRGVLLQTRLPFGISSAPGCFQKIMEQLTSDLRGVAVCLDDILVSGNNAEEHIQNLRALLERLNEKGLRCKLEKCSFAQPSVECPRVQDRRSCQDATAYESCPSSSFLGSVQFYGRFIPNLSTLTEPLNRLTRKDAAVEQAAFQRLKDALRADAVLAHFGPSQQIGISCDASEVGVGEVLFHRYGDGSERPIANVPKTLTESQVEKEALAVIFVLRKFHQFLCGRRFILVTDH
ncbi:LOW QUALITY PROTEIN: hypothetical protein M514_25463 [Trichuris suis]|uniref:Reverse transcriptase domain-containing protein n=1 Tax=Trichuris suis TaxID=68888 RepID=A0A085MYP4_9BILA|nr:LOW QUALITY PROTEIN: hypothetical protein M514_25463 [Trichuris suis]